MLGINGEPQPFYGTRLFTEPIVSLQTSCGLDSSHKKLVDSFEAEWKRFNRHYDLRLELRGAAMSCDVMMERGGEPRGGGPARGGRR